MANPKGHPETLKPWPKGVSGNPNGRPKASQRLKEQAEKELDKAFKELVKLTKSKDERVKLNAITEIINRGAGKPPTVVEGNEESPIVVEHRLTQAKKAFLASIAESDDEGTAGEDR